LAFYLLRSSATDISSAVGGRVGIATIGVGAILGVIVGIGIIDAGAGI
jgi:hypothetical protein